MYITMAFCSLFKERKVCMFSTIFAFSTPFDPAAIVFTHGCCSPCSPVHRLLGSRTNILDIKSLHPTETQSHSSPRG